MRPEQEGAWIRLGCFAWADGSREPSLPSDAESLAFMSRLGERWTKLGGLILEQLELRDGRLYNTGWSNTWHEQQAKYAAAASKGSKGGANKAAARAGGSSKKGSSSAVAQLPLRNPSPFLKAGKISSSATAQLPLSSSSALAEGQQLEVAVVQQLERDGPPQSAEPVRSEDPKPENEQLDLAIGVKVEAYRLAHPDDASKLEGDVRAELRVSRKRMLEPEQQRLVDRRMLELIETSPYAEAGLRLVKNE